MNIKRIKMLKRLDSSDPLSQAANSNTHVLQNEKLPPEFNGYEAIINEFSPNNALSQIPIISVAGANGKTIVTQMIAHILSETGHAVKTRIDFNQINQDFARNLNAANECSTKNVVSDAPKEIFVLETLRREILERGLNYEWSDVSIITNIQSNIDGSGEVESKNEALQIESLIAEHVRQNGTLVLNADDEIVARFRHEPRIAKIKKNIVYFSLKSNHILLRRHVSAGNRVYTIKDDWLIEVDRAGENRILEISDVPATFNGAAEFNIANVLAAVAVCRTQNLCLEQIAAGLKSFHAPTRENNLASFYEVDQAYIFFEQIRNYEAFKAVCQMAANLGDGERRVSAIIGFSGDQNNELLEQVGYLAARSFDRVTLRENHDFCERASGGTTQNLYQTIKGAAPERDCRIILSEDEALRREITRLRENDILICFYENPELVRQILKRCDAVPVLKLKKECSRPTFNLRQA